MAKCVFCSREVGIGKGNLFVTTDGRILHFCSGKCKKHFNLGRSKKQGWLVKKRK
jgi:large subunit ribosomal protein L24e